MASNPKDAPPKEADKKEEETAVPDFPHLSHKKAALNLKCIMEKAREDLTKCLSKVKGQKILVLDEQLLAPVGQIADKQFFESEQVEKMYRLSDKTFETDSPNVVYLCRPKIPLIKNIATQIKHLLSTKKTLKGGGTQQFYILLVPRITLIARKVIYELGVQADCVLDEFPLDLVPLEYDTMSMELPNAFRECVLEGDLSSLYYVARAIMKLQSFFGLIPHIKYMGENAMKVFEMVLRMRRTCGNDVFNSVPEIDTLILVDRSVDLISPLYMQMTYEGLIDELFGIKTSLFTPNFACVPEQKPEEKPKVWLRSSDVIFDEIRDLNQQHVGKQLKEKAQEIDKQIKMKDTLKTVQDIKNFTKMLPFLKENKKNLEMHINIVQQIRTILGGREFKKIVEIMQNCVNNDNEKANLDHIEEMIARQDDLKSVLRLMCLWSVTSNGIRAKHFDYLRGEILQSYGFEALLTLNNLEKAGLCIRNLGSPKNWKTLKTKLNLLKQEPDKAELQSTYVGYAPITASLIEKANNPPGSDWKSPAVAEALNAVGGPHDEYLQKNAMITQNDKKVILVFFIGGCTFAEISALRYLNEKYSDAENGRVYIACTTGILNGDTFMEKNMFEYCPNFIKLASKREFDTPSVSCRLNFPNILHH